MSADKVEKLIKDNKVEFVDLRFADVRGIQHHVTFPANIVDESLFEDGRMFDGSSISGWKGTGHSRRQQPPKERHLSFRWDDDAFFLLRLLGRHAPKNSGFIKHQ